MFGKSLGRKAIEKAAGPVLSGFVDSAKQGNSINPARDAVLMFVGWLHYAISYLLSARQMSASDIAPVTIAAALAVRLRAGDHGLGTGYLEAGMQRIKAALSSEGAWEGRWAFNYFDAVREEASISQETFGAALLAEALALHQIPDLRVR